MPATLGEFVRGRFTTADIALSQLMLEVLTRRYYRIQMLTDLRPIAVDGQRCVSAGYEKEGEARSICSPPMRNRPGFAKRRALCSR